MAEIDALNVTVKANADQFLAAMQMVEQNTARAAEALEGLSAASASADQSHQASASAIGMATAAWEAGFAAVEELAGKLVELGQASVEAATQMDPQAALAYAAATDHMHDAIGNLEAKIGAALLPTLDKFKMKVGDVAQKLANMPWGEYAKQAQPFFDGILASAQDWGGKLLDLLTWPLRQFVGYTEQALGAVMQQVGDLLNKIGGTAIGKKIGIGEFSGDALSQTGADMQKQAEKIKKSFASAWSEVANGAKVTIGAALDAINAKTNGLVDRMKSDFTSAGTDSGRTRNEAVDAAERQSMTARLAFENQIAQMKDQEAQAEISMQRMIARERKAELMSEAQQQEQHLQEMKQKLSQDRSSGNLGALAVDQAAVTGALAATQQAYAAAVAESQKSLTEAQGLASKLTADYGAQVEIARKALEAANKAHEAAAKAGNNVQLQDAAAQADAAYQRQQQHMAQLNSQKIAAATAVKGIEIQTQNEIKADKLRTAHEAAAIEDEAMKARMAFYKSTIDGLAKSALGGVGSSALSAGQQGFAAAGPAGAAIGVGASLIQNSAGLKKMGDAISAVLQQVADALGTIFLPLVPVIEKIGTVISPFLDAIKRIAAPIGAIAAQILTGLLPLLKALEAPIIAILQPLGDLLIAIGPLIAPIVQISVLIFTITELFDPFTLALMTFAPLLSKVATVIRDIVSAIAGVWNGIVGEVVNILYQFASWLPVGGDAVRSFADTLKGTEIDINGFDAAVNQATGAVTAAAIALGYLQSQSLDLASLMGDQRAGGGDSSTKEIANAIMQAWFGSTGANGVNNVAGVTSDLYNNAVANLMKNDGGQQYVNAVDQAYQQSSNAQQADAQAAAKATSDQATISAIQAALQQTSDPAVKAELEKQLQQAQQQYTLDQDAKAVADAQAAIAADQLRVAEDQLTIQVLLAEQQEALAEGNTAAYNALGAQLGEMWGTTFGQIGGQLGQDQASSTQDQKALAQAQAQQALDQAKATIANSSATSANTKATKDLSQQLSNMVSGFNVNNAIYQAQGGNHGAGGGGGSTGSALGASLGAVAASKQIIDLVKGSLRGEVAAGMQNGITIHGDVVVEVDSKNPNDFADRLENALRTRNFRRRGVSVTSTGGEFP
jgi:hypothetical protein